jgi:hypothetical protein
MPYLWRQQIYSLIIIIVIIIIVTHAYYYMSMSFHLTFLVDSLQNLKDLCLLGVARQLTRHSPQPCHFMH